MTLEEFDKQLKEMRKRAPQTRTFFANLKTYELLKKAGRLQDSVKVRPNTKPKRELGQGASTKEEEGATHE